VVSQCFWAFCAAGRRSNGDRLLGATFAVHWPYALPNQTH
jgi:hypothetical protein